jgi:hypothetical protein
LTIAPSSPSNGRSTLVASQTPLTLFAYFPIGDIEEGVLQPSDHESTHPNPGET